MSMVPTTNEPDDSPIPAGNSEPADAVMKTNEPDECAGLCDHNLDRGKGDMKANETLRQLGAGTSYQRTK